MDRRGPHPDVRKRGLVSVTLECGHQITVRNQPLSKHATYACPARAGHGYRLPWLRFHNKASNVEQLNPLFEKES